jgi:beta-lactamase regulating signal transducer with metallopeptidase domain
MAELLNSIADYWAAYQWAMFWQVGVLIAILWGIDVSIHKWVWPQVRYALWMLVLVKLLIPPTLTSPASVTQHIPAAAEKVVSVRLHTPEVPDNAAMLPRDTGVAPVTIPPASQPDAAPTEPDKQTKASGRQAETSASPSVPEGLHTVAGGETPGTDAFSPASPAGATEKGSLSWKAWAMLTWLAGVIVLTAWLAARLRGLRKQHAPDNCHAGLDPASRQHRPGPRLDGRGDNAQFNELLVQAAAKLKLKRLPEVIVTERVSCPAVFGVFRPVLLMPATKLQNLDSRDMEHILLHELAHIKRGDLWVHAVYMVLQIAYWFNPLLWMIRRTMQNLRELCCDATVARLLKEDTVHYRQTLLETARGLLAQPVDPGLGLLGLFENSNWLVTRLKWLEKKTWKNRPLRIATVLVLVSIMAVCVLPMANRTKVFATEGTENTESIDFTKTLDNGATLELVGICEHPSEGRAWWGPDGGPRGEAPYPKMETAHTAAGWGWKAYEAAVRISGVDDFGYRNRISDSGGGGSCSTDEPGIHAISFSQPKNRTQTQIEIGVAAGAWQTVSTQKADFSGVISGENLIWHGPIEQNGHTLLTMAHGLLDQNTRIVAVGTDGKEHTGGSTSATQNSMQSVQTRFRRPLSKIKEFRLQSRPYEWMTFQNVALRPGVKTDVEAKTENSDLSDLVPAKFEIVYNEQRGVHYLVVKIKNESEAELPKHRVRFYRGEPAVGLDETGHPHSGWHEAGPIEPGKEWNERTQDFHLPDGEYAFSVVLDYDNAIAETNEDNNDASLNVRIKDGQITDSEQPIPPRVPSKLSGQVVSMDGKAAEGAVVAYASSKRTVTLTSGGIHVGERKRQTRGWACPHRRRRAV